MDTKKFTLGDDGFCYFDNGRDGVPLIFIHGNSLSAGLFYQQFNCPGLNAYRLLALELPGHGGNGHSPQPEKDYSVRNYIDFVLGFIKTLGLVEVVLLGHSLGGHIAIHVADEIEGADIKGLIVSGTPPLTIPPRINEAFLPNPVMGLAYRANLSAEDLPQLASAYCSPACSGHNLLHESLAQCDPLVRPMAGQSIARDLTTDEAGIIRKAKFPVAILHGENDSLINCGYIRDLKLPIWRGGVVVIENAGHSPFIENAGAFNQMVVGFMNEI